MRTRVTTYRQISDGMGIKGFRPYALPAAHTALFSRMSIAFTTASSLLATSLFQISGYTAKTIKPKASCETPLLAQLENLLTQDNKGVRDLIRKLSPQPPYSDQK
jgi:hypothetical protein